MTGLQYDIEPGYEFQDEFAVESDHMGEGALRFTLVALTILIVVIVAVVQWARMEGYQAMVENSVVEPPPALRTARAEATRKLTQYELLDAETGVYQIPIERAIALEALDHANE